MQSQLLGHLFCGQAQPDHVVRSGHAVLRSQVDLVLRRRVFVVVHLQAHVEGLERGRHAATKLLGRIGGGEVEVPARIQRHELPI